ncbi:MAG TPA: DUF2273 domain-containing protein [Desulfotomaculum sp.]|nr:DUF2273 domain-containing protein [Desulfotomaculum sp.]
MDWKDMQELWRQHRGKITGVFLGLAFGWFAIIYGIFKAVFVALCVAVGYYVGKRLDERVDFREMLSRLFQER